MEKQTSTLPRLARSAGSAADWERRYRELETVHAIFASSVRRALRIESPVQLHTILDVVIAVKANSDLWKTIPIRKTNKRTIKPELHAGSESGAAAGSPKGAPRVKREHGLEEAGVFATIALCGKLMWLSKPLCLQLRDEFIALLSENGSLDRLDGGMRAALVHATKALGEVNPEHALTKLHLCAAIDALLEAIDAERRRSSIDQDQRSAP